MVTLTDLPIEVLHKILVLCHFEFRTICKLFYALHNDFYRGAFQLEFGIGVYQRLLQEDYLRVVELVRSHDFWRGPLREMVANYNHSVEPFQTEDSQSVANFKYLNDSWQMIYSLYKNHRAYIENGDYCIDDGEIRGNNTGRIVRPAGHRRRSSLEKSITLMKRVYLTPGVYNCSCGVILKNKTFRGLSSSQFTISNGLTGESLLSYSPPTHLDDLIPTDKFTILNLGDFIVAKPQIEALSEEEEETVQHRSQTEDNRFQCNFIPVDINMFEIVHLDLSDYIICYIDMNAYSPDQIGQKRPQPLAWWINNETPHVSNVINDQLVDFNKELYSSIESLLQKREPRAVQNEPTAASQHNLSRPIESIYSRVNARGDLITRSFKWLTVKDMKLAEETRTEHTHDDNSPLWFKMNSLYRL